MAALIAACWDADPKARPTMAAVRDRLTAIAGEAAREARMSRQSIFVSSMSLPFLTPSEQQNGDEH